MSDEEIEDSPPTNQRITAGVPNDSSNNNNDVHPGLFGWRQRKTNFENEGDESARPPRLDDLAMDEEYGRDGDDDTNQTKGLMMSGGDHSDNDDFDNENDEEAYTEREKRAGVISIVISSKILAIVILVFLIITHSLLGRECYIASKSLMATLKADHLSSRSITTWRALPGNELKIRTAVHTTSKLIAKFPPSKAETMEFEVYGKPHLLKGGTKRLHIVSPVNGWATEITNKGKRYMEPIAKKEVMQEEGGIESLGETPHLPICPIFDAGYTSINSLSRYHYAPTALVVAQQFWNAAQVFYLFLLISLYGVMTSPSFAAASSMKRASQLVSEKTGKSILWCCYIIVTILSVILLPFSLYYINPGGHVFAILMTIMSLGSFYFAAPNVRYNLADLPPRCCTPRHHPGALMQPKEIVETNYKDEEEDDAPPTEKTFTGTNVDETFVVHGRGICKVEFIAFVCNLSSSMYNYGMSRGHVFPNWKKIFHTIDGWFGFVGENIKLNYEIPGRFMFNMGIHSYHLPLFMPLSFGSTIGAYVFMILWSILPFVYVFYFMYMYVMAKRAPGVRIQRFFALFGVFHFLFLTDVVSYKYGRGLRNEISEWCHWAERAAWRIAIILPIYQNVMSGHYRHATTTQRNKWIGTALHYFMAFWGLLFFTYQFLINDCLHFPQWLMGRKQTHMFGWPYSYTIGYLGSLMVMVFIYGFMMIGGTWCHHVYVGPEDHGKKGVRVWKTHAKRKRSL